MTSTAVAYRFRIRTRADDADLLIATSLATSDDPTRSYNYLCDPPTGDGLQIDPLTGQVTVGAFTIPVTDQTGTVTQDGNTAVGRIVTSILADATARQQLLGLKALLERSTDGGTTWPVVFAAFVGSIRMVSAIRYDIQITDTRRVDLTIPFDVAAGSLKQQSILLGTGPIAPPPGSA